MILFAHLGSRYPASAFAFASLGISNPSLLTQILSFPSPFSKLKELSLPFSNEISYAKPIHKLTQLQRLTIDAVNLVALTDGLAEMSTLVYLDVSLTNLSEQPSDFGSLVDSVCKLPDLCHLTSRKIPFIYPSMFTKLATLPRLNSLMLESSAAALFLSDQVAGDVNAMLLQFTRLTCLWCNMFLPPGAAATLACLSNLKSLSLAVTDADVPQLMLVANLHLIAKRPSGAFQQTLLRIIKRKQLKKLYLECFSIHCLEPLLETLANPNKQLKVLGLWSVAPSRALQSSLQRLTYLEELCLSARAGSFSKPGITGFSSLLGLTSLSRLTVNWVTINPAAAKEICLLSSLRVLEIDDCNMERGALQQRTWLPLLEKVVLSEEVRGTLKFNGFPKHKIAFK